MVSEFQRPQIGSLHNNDIGHTVEVRAIGLDCIVVRWCDVDLHPRRDVFSFDDFSLKFGS